MRNLTKYITASQILLVVCGFIFSIVFESMSYGQYNENTAFYGDYTSVLKEYVDNYGMVNYRGLKAGRTSLDAFTNALVQFDSRIFDTWSEKDKIAFWINAYNSLTLKTIIDNYPIKASVLSGLIYPKNSIRQISGVWDKKKFTVIGEKMTLDHIEHKILRTQYDEPGIHMALVCAAMSCPPLRNEPYTGEKLDDQLDDQTRRFINHPQKFTIDKQNERVYLSSIFKWFGKDFIKRYGTNTAYNEHSDSERAVLNFISNYISSVDREFLRNESYKVSYVDYDWSLNEKK